MSVKDIESLRLVFLELHCAEQKKFRACSTGGDGRDSQVSLRIQWVVIRKTHDIGNRLPHTKDSGRKLEGDVLDGCPVLEDLQGEAAWGLACPGRGVIAGGGCFRLRWGRSCGSTSCWIVPTIAPHIPVHSGRVPSDATRHTLLA